MYLYYSRDTGISNFVTLKGKTKKVKKKSKKKEQRITPTKIKNFVKN